MSAASPMTIRLGSRELPVFPPRLGDARIHTSAVIFSIHIIGITTLGFEVSVPQILVAILSAAVIDAAITLMRTGALVWPASGILTGSGVGLILRLVGMESGDYWSWAGWHYFAGIAAVSVLTKHVIRVGDRHLFNPSNVGLVAAFVVFGSEIIEPLDFWWAPMGFWMALAYSVIIVGGIAITRRLGLLGIVGGFFLTFVIGLAILSASGHCMTASWSAASVCGVDFWTVLVTSPEVLVFALFMITDPRTIPQNRAARLLFAGSLGVLATLLIAPNSVEFGAKVGLLGSLVLLSPLRGFFDRALANDRIGTTEGATARLFARGAAVGSIVVLIGSAIVLAGGPARSSSVIADIPEIDVTTPPDSIPDVSVDQDALRLIGGIDPNGLAIQLVENLTVESEAIRSGDGGLLAGASAGIRLIEMQQRLDEALATGTRLVPTYQFEKLHLSIAESDDPQAGAGLAFAGSGTVETTTYDALGVELESHSQPFESTFTMRQVAGERWLIVEVTSGQ